MKVEPNGYLLFKTALGTETKVKCHVKISGPMKVWFGDGQEVFVPSQASLPKCEWFKQLEKKHGKCQGIEQIIPSVIVPGEPEPEGKPLW